MRAGKAYISSLGTTGLLIASSLLLLVVAGAMFAFDRWPAHATADETVVVPIAAAPAERDGSGASREPAGAERSRRGRAEDAGTRGSRAPARLPRASARIAATQVAADSDALVEVAAPADPVVTDLPAPDSSGDGRGAGPDGSAPSAPAPPADPGPDAETPGQPQLPDLAEILPDPAEEASGLTAVTSPLAESVAPLTPQASAAVRQSGAAVDGTLSGLINLAATKSPQPGVAARPR